MPAFIIFQADQHQPSLAEFSAVLNNQLGLGLKRYKEGKAVPVGDYSGLDEGGISEAVFVELLDLEKDEGLPVVKLDSFPRLDRSEELQEIVDQILDQESSLSTIFNENARDILIGFEETPAAIEASCALAYAVACELQTGILLLSHDETDGTVWFPDAEEFADFAFGEDEEEPSS